MTSMPARVGCGRISGGSRGRDEWNDRQGEVKKRGRGAVGITMVAETAACRKLEIWSYCVVLRLQGRTLHAGRKR